MKASAWRSPSRSARRALDRALVIATLSLATLASHAFAADKEVTIAYQDMMVPWRYAQQLDEAGKETGYKVSYRKFGGGGDVIRAMASGNVQVGEAGSSPVAAGLSQGLPIELFWILDNINDAEALVARDGSGVATVAQLKGKRLGVPFVSTSHFHALLALKQAGLSVRRQGPQHASRRDRGRVGTGRYRCHVYLEPGVVEGGSERQGRDDVREDRRRDGPGDLRWLRGQSGTGRKPIRNS